jgi:UDP-N-acetylmuramoyl-L-alanyl-D-glutamate--2,6-diaminopimelate ligase
MSIIPNYSRAIIDFLDHKTAENAGIIEVKNGNFSPLPFESAFALPSSILITALEYDSRKVTKGALYFALTGLHTDGHNFIDDAISRGAQAVVHEIELPEYREGIIYIKVKDSRYAMSAIADAFFGFASRCMSIIGVTGTEGKTTTVYLIYQLLKLMGKKTGFISTVQQSDGINETWNNEHQTTPEAITVHRLLAEMNLNGAEFAVLESSSHGLSKKTSRLADVDFDVGVVTNLTHDHLEFHGSWERYRSDKAELLRALDVSPSSHKKQGSLIPSFAVLNADDPSAEYFASATAKKTFTFSVRGKAANLTIRAMESRKDGNRYEVFDAESGKTFSVSDSLPGAFNAGNVLAALLVVSNLLSLGTEEILPQIQFLKPVRGRMSSVNRGQPFEVLVDFAHTPSSFQAVFPPLRERLNSSGGKLISLFGSAGERDTKKRPLQGEIAARYSDLMILTDEDPRGEAPMTILEEIAKGCVAGPGCIASPGQKKMIREENLFLIPNRPRAIRKAFSLARAGDLVLLLGKGHENSIIYTAETIIYDEIGEAEKALEEAGYRSL